MEALQRHAYSEASTAFNAVLMGFAAERAILDRARVYLDLCTRELNRRPPSPKTLEERLTAATAALNNADDAAAEDLVRSVLGDDPKHELALYLLAVIHARRGATVEALDFLAKAIAISPEASAQARTDEDFVNRNQLIALMFLLAVTAARAQTAIVDYFKGKTASAMFTIFDSTHCIETDIFINATESINHQPGTKKWITNQSGFGIGINNNCNGDLFIATDGVSSHQDLTISRDFSNATVTAVVPLQDQIGRNFTATVQVTWTATSPVVKNKTVTIDHTDPSFLVSERLTGTGCDAVATCTVTLSGADPYFASLGTITATSTQASIQDLTDSSTIVIHPTKP